MNIFEEMNEIVDDFIATVDGTVKEQSMLGDKTLRLRAQLSVLKDVAKEYSGRTIENIIDNIEARIKYAESHARENRVL